MMRPNHPWPFHSWLMLGVAPVLAFGYAALDSGSFWLETLSRGQIVGRDFLVFWSAAMLLWRGDVLTLFDPGQFQTALHEIAGQTLAVMPFPYPPNALLILWPLGLLPLTTALLFWLTGTFVALATLLRRFGTSWANILAVLLSPASIVNICSGQTGFLSAALLGSGLLLVKHRPILAGILLGLLSYKPQHGLLIPFLLIAGGYWYSFAAASITVVVMIVLSLPVVGLEAWRLYLNVSAPHHFSFLQYGSGFFQQMSPTYFMNMRLLGADLWLAWMAQILMTALIASATIWAFRQKASHDLKVAIALVAAILISPYALTYDLVIVCVAIMLAARVEPWGLATKTIFCLTWLLPLAALLPLPSFGSLILTLLFCALWHRLYRMASMREVILDQAAGGKTLDV